MFYYAIVNDNCYCTSVVSSTTEINDNHYIEITEEQYTSQSVVGMYWNVTDVLWDYVRYFSCNTYDIDYDRTGKVLQYQFDDMNEAIAANTAAIPTKTSQLTNDSGFKTVDTNTTYSLSKSGSTITLTGSDGSSTSVTDSDSNTTYSKATDTVLGLVKVGFAESGKNYPVELNANGQMFVNVPWTDNNTVYTHPTYTAKSSGLYKVAVDGTGHVSGATAVTKADITGLGIPAQDTVYTLPAAGTALGGVKTGGDVTISNGTITVNDDSHAHVISNVDGLQTALDGKAASSHTHSYLPLSGGTVSGDTNITGVLRVNGQQSFYFQTSTMSQTVGTNNATGGTTIAGGADSTCNINGAIVKTAAILPRSTNTYYCGNANYRWKGIYSSAAVNVSSDERLKENIVKLHADEAVDFINSVDVCSFNYIGDESEQIGVMAQDILAKAPNLAKALVTQDENGYYGVKTSDLVFPLIIAVQELTKQVKELKGE